MRLLRTALSLLLVGSVIGACGDESTGVNPELTLANLAGTWEATEIRVTQTAPPGPSVDAYSLGVRFTVVIESNGAYAMTITAPNVDEPLSYSGTMTVKNSTTLTMTDAIEGPDDVSVQFTGETLTIVGSSPIALEDDDEKEYQLRLVLQRQ